MAYEVNLGRIETPPGSFHDRYWPKGAIGQLICTVMHNWEKK